MKHFNSYSFTVGLLIGVTTGYIIHSLINQSNQVDTKINTKIQLQDQFLLNIIIKFNTIQDKKLFKDLLASYVPYVKTFELTTISYEYFDSDKDELQGYLIERYINKDSYLNIHRKSKEFLEFREKLSTLINNNQLSIEGHSYIQSNIGFV